MRTRRRTGTRKSRMMRMRRTRSIKRRRMPGAVDRLLVLSGGDRLRRGTGPQEEEATGLGEGEEEGDPPFTKSGP